MFFGIVVYFVISMQGLAILKNLYNKQYDRDIYFVVISCIILQVLANIKAEKVRNVKYIVITQKETYKTLFEPVKRGKYYFIRITDKNEVENTLLNNFDKDRFQVVSQRFDNHYHALVFLASKLCDYDFVGHFHTEAFGNEGKLVDEATRHALVDMLSDEEKVVSIFDHFPEVGLVFADLSKELYWTDEIATLNQEQTVKLTNECQKVTNHSLHIFQGSMWLSKDFLENIILKDEHIFYDLDENTLSYLFYRKAWDVGIDYRIIASEEISFAERYKVHLIEMSQVAEPLTLKSKFSAYRKILLKKLGLKKSSAV